MLPNQVRSCIEETRHSIIRRKSDPPRGVLKTGNSGAGVGGNVAAPERAHGFRIRRQEQDPDPLNVRAFLHPVFLNPAAMPLIVAARA